MNLSFRTRKLKLALEDEARRRKEYGADMAKKIALRLTALVAAESLADFWPPKQGPERCHRLTGDLSGTFSMDVKQPYRLLFEPVDLPEPQPDDELERWKTIRSVEILGIEDTHE
jgi:proteic killer suppression protein